MRGKRLRDGCSLREAGLLSNPSDILYAPESNCTISERSKVGNSISDGARMIMTNLVVDVSLLNGLQGGGGDGGSTGAESRSAYLEMYAEKKKDKADRTMTRFNRYTTCALSGSPLDEVAVVDVVGNIINKEELLRRMLDGSLRKLSGMGHIRSLKDVYDITLTKRTRESILEDGKEDEESTVQFCCPVLGLPLNGKFNFVLLKKHHLVVSERALRNAKLAVEEMIGAKFTIDESNVLSLYPPDDIAEERRAEAMVWKSRYYDIPSCQNPIQWR